MLGDGHRRCETVNVMTLVMKYEMQRRLAAFRAPCIYTPSVRPSVRAAAAVLLSPSFSELRSLLDASHVAVTAVHYSRRQFELH